MELQSGQNMKLQDLANFFNVSRQTVQRHKEKYLEMLKEYASYEIVLTPKGRFRHITIKEVYDASAKPNRYYRQVFLDWLLDENNEELIQQQDNLIEVVNLYGKIAGIHLTVDMELGKYLHNVAKYESHVNGKKIISNESIKRPKEKSIPAGPALYFITSEGKDKMFWKVGKTTDWKRRRISYITHSPTYKLIDVCNVEGDLEQLEVKVRAVIRSYFAASEKVYDTEWEGVSYEEFEQVIKKINFEEVCKAIGRESI